MVDHPDEFGPKEPRPATPERDDADFFQEVTDADEPATPAAFAEHSVATPGAPSPRRQPEPPLPPSLVAAEPKHPVFPIIMGLLFVGALVGAVIYARKAETEAAANAPAPAAPAALTTSAAPEPSPIDALTGEVKSLQGKIDGLAAQTKDLQDRFDKLPQLQSAPDLKPLQTQIDKLARTASEVAPLPKQVGDLDGRVAAMVKSLAALCADITALQGDAKKTATTPQPESTDAPKAESSTPSSENANIIVAGEGLEQGVQLFKDRKYKEAGDLFRKLTDEFPKDARVWYYAALSNGLATNQWRGETERLVNQGVEREKAGSPKAPEIDAVMTDLAPASKKWLDFYRQRAH